MLSVCKKSFVQFSLFLCGLFLLGIGCSQTPKTNTVNKNTTPTSTPETTLVAMTQAQEAYVYCVLQNYSIKIQMQTEVAPQQILCEFPDGSACLAEAFLQDDCLPGEYFPPTTEAVALATAEDDIYGGRYCEPVADPVCGADGRTYTNACIAELSGQKTYTPDSCPDNGQPLSNPDRGEDNSEPTGTESNNQENNGGGNQGETPTETGSTNTAQSIRASLPPNSQISQCPANNQNYYLVRTACPECVSILYSSGGDLLCYPGHDVAGKCPEAFSGRTPASCRII